MSQRDGIRAERRAAEKHFASPGKDQKIGSAKAEPVTGQAGYYWAIEKVGFAAKPSERYYVQAKRTESPACASARSPARNGPEGF